MPPRRGRSPAQRRPPRAKGVPALTDEATGASFQRPPPAVARRPVILELPDRTEIPAAAARIFADSHGGIADKSVGRYRQIVGRGNAAEHAAGRIVFRAVAGA